MKFTEQRIHETKLDPKKVDKLLALGILNGFTDEERLDLMNNFCRDCGAKQPWNPDVLGEKWTVELGCQCANDE